MSNAAQASVPPSDEDANLDVVDEREVSWIIVETWGFQLGDIKMGVLRVRSEVACRRGL